MEKKVHLDFVPTHWMYAFLFDRNLFRQQKRKLQAKYNIFFICMSVIFGFDRNLFRQQKRRLQAKYNIFFIHVYMLSLGLGRFKYTLEKIHFDINENINDHDILYFFWVVSLLILDVSAVYVVNWTRMTNNVCGVTGRASVRRWGGDWFNSRPKPCHS